MCQKKSFDLLHISGKLLTGLHFGPGVIAFPPLLRQDLPLLGDALRQMRHGAAEIGQHGRQRVEVRQGRMETVAPDFGTAIWNSHGEPIAAIAIRTMRKLERFGLEKNVI